MLSEEDLRPLNNGDFYSYQIAGCSVLTERGEQIGKVKDVMFIKGNDLLVIERGDKEILIPIVRTICLKINIEKREIVINPPEGLLELNEI